MFTMLRFIKRSTKYFILLLFIYSVAYGQNTVLLNLSVKRTDYAKVRQAVQAANGQVRFEYKFINKMAVTLPADKVKNILSLPEVSTAKKDILINIPKPIALSKTGYGDITKPLTFSAVKSESKTVDDLKASISSGLNNYYPYTNDLTNTNNFYQQAGHFGEGIVVAVIDAGVSSAATAVSNRLLGGENFTGDGIPATSPANFWHGTAVACCIGANAVFGFSNPVVQNAVKNYAPNSVIPNLFAPGIDGIPMVGQAPGALFYALKVFKTDGSSTPASVVVAALERAIELKELYNSGQGGLNIRVINMSLGGPTLFAGNDPDYSQLIQRALDDGIFLAISAGNEGPSGMTIGDPGDVKNVVTCGATNDATHDRIIADLQYGHNVGFLYRPANNNQTAYFSSRGPNADGRPDPDIAAPGWYRYCQQANGSIIWASGTSFSAPTIAGAAALLLSARPQSTPAEIRAALLNGAKKNVLTDNSGKEDQGFGFLDVNNAYKKLTAGAFNPPDAGVNSHLLPVNVSLGDNDIKIIPTSSFSGFTGNLRPGQRAEYYFPVTKQMRKVTVTISGITPQLAPAQQNQLFGDDVLFAIQGAITSTGDYLKGTPGFLATSHTFELTGQDLSLGLLRVTVVGDWTNAGNISAGISIAADIKSQDPPSLLDQIAQGQEKNYSFNIPSNTQSLDMKLFWLKGWDKYPTNDLDLFLTDPKGNLIVKDVNNDGLMDGATLKMPEIISVANPIAGNWTATVVGFTIFNNHEQLHINALLNGNAVINKPGQETAPNAISALPADFKLQQNMPNPFNPSTIIQYELPVNTFTTLRVYNGLGQLVRTLVNEIKPAGYHSALFDGRDESGNELPSGMYIYQISSDKFIKSGKMMLIK